MKIKALQFYLDKQADPDRIHPFSHYLFREQASVFCHWLTARNEMRVSLPRPVSLRIDIVDPSRPPGLRLFDRATYIIDCPVPFARYASLPFDMVESRMSKLLRSRGQTSEVEQRPLFAADQSNDLFLEILLNALGHCGDIFQTDAGVVRENFRNFAKNGYRASWLKARKPFPEFGGTAELEYNLDAYSMRKEIVLRRKGAEIDRSLVTEQGPEDLSWAGSFPVRIEGKEVVMGHGTFRYEPFHGVRIVSLST